MAAIDMLQEIDYTYRVITKSGFDEGRSWR